MTVVLNMVEPVIWLIGKGLGRVWGGIAATLLAVELHAAHCSMGSLLPTMGLWQRVAIVFLVSCTPMVRMPWALLADRVEKNVATTKEGGLQAMTICPFGRGLQHGFFSHIKGARAGLRLTLTRHSEQPWIALATNYTSMKNVQVRPKFEGAMLRLGPSTAPRIIGLTFVGTARCLGARAAEVGF